MAEKNLTPFKAERELTINKIFEYKRTAETNLVSSIYKQPDLIFELENITTDDFDEDACRVFFAIAQGVLIGDKNTTLTAGSINIYLEKHPKLKEKYDEYGGWNEISGAAAYANTENFDSYISELYKWQAVIGLAAYGLIDRNKLSHFADITIEDIHNEVLEHVDKAFKHSIGKNKVYNAFEGLPALVDELDRGEEFGLPFFNAPLLTEEIGGIKLNGNIYALGAGSGVGKSTMAFNYLFNSIMSKKEKMVFIINEENHKKFQKEMLLWIANNSLIENSGEYIQKKELSKGHFSTETRATLEKSAEQVEKFKKTSQFMIIPLERYSVKEVIRIINEYSTQGVKLFVLDTFKESCDAATDDIYKSMTRDMRDLYDTIKPEARNVSLFITYQLSKGSLKTRHLTNGDVGQARSIVDVMSANLMMRRPFSDEFKGGAKELKCWHEKNGQKEEFCLQPGKQYMITFIAKNRFGRTDEVQIVSECDLGTNIHKDIGYCIVPCDSK